MNLKYIESLPKVLAPMRKAPVAYSPGFVTGRKLGCLIVAMPYKKHFIYQGFKKDELIFVN